MRGTLRSRLLAQQTAPAPLLRQRSQTALAAEESSGHLTVGLPIHPPSPAHRLTLRTALSEALHSGEPPDRWPLRLLRGSAWVILDAPPPHAGEADTTAGVGFGMAVPDDAALLAYLTAMATKGGVGGGRILLHSYLRCYPKERPGLEPLRHTLFSLLTEGTSVAAKARRTVLRPCLLAPNGPALLAQRLLRANPGHVLSTIGLTGDLAEGRFVELAWEQLVKELRTAKPSAAGFGTKLRVLLALSLDNSGLKLRFPKRAPLLAEALLLPWVGLAHELPVGIRNLLCTHLGDPRTEPTHWTTGVSEKARQVLTRHLAGEVLADFFNLLDALAHRDPAIDSHRHQRRALWEACHAQGALTDAWLAIGPLVLPEARSLLGVRARRYAELGSASGTRARQVIVLLRIAGVTVVEWSHLGPYYCWRPGNAAAPYCYQAHYRYEALERDTDLVRPHHNDKRGDWRVEFLHHLALMTGVRIDLPQLGTNG